MSHIKLQSERLRLEPYTIADFYFVKSLLQDPRVMRFISPDGKPYTDEQTIEWFERQLARYQTGRQTGLLKLMSHEND
ncbi:GNAT family N-acetyltransferase, partial [Klebsiella pneumoniae]|nr:GNAT family N-acetyltransferase [Klebsiella pneumoniae]